MGSPLVTRSVRNSEWDPSWDEGYRTSARRKSEGWILKLAEDLFRASPCLNSQQVRSGQGQLARCILFRAEVSEASILQKSLEAGGQLPDEGTLVHAWVMGVMPHVFMR